MEDKTTYSTNKNSNKNNGEESDPFTKGVEVEVNCEDEGFRGSWYTAKILQPIFKDTGKLFLQYHALMSSRDRTKPLKEWVDSILVRPVPPRELSRSFQPSEEVDAFHNDGWWEGVVIESFLGVGKKKNKYSVYFRTSREQLVFDEANLRLHREWVHGNWVPPLDDSTVTVRTNAGYVKLGAFCCKKFHRESILLHSEDSLCMAYRGPGSGHIKSIICYTLVLRVVILWNTSLAGALTLAKLIRVITLVGNGSPVFDDGSLIIFSIEDFLDPNYEISSPILFTQNSKGMQLWFYKIQTCVRRPLEGQSNTITDRGREHPTENGVVQFAKLERHRGDRHFENHRGGVSGDAHHHHHHQQQHHSNHQHHFDHHHHNQHDHQYSNHSNNQFVNNEQNNTFVGDGFRHGGFGSGHSAPLSGRKRGFHLSNRGSSPDYSDRGSVVKLYVASIPRTVTEDDIRPLFEEHGNVVEIVLLKDKRTGQQHGACFVKYAKVEEADRAIKVLHNLQAFPGAPDTLIVRYADGERERFGTPGEKLYIRGLNKQASKREIEEIFSPYGVVEDIYIVRDELSQSRGSGFVKLSNIDMAVAAMNALNGTYIMRGCDQPLIVRFADPMKPRNGNSRVNSAHCGPNFGPRSQESLTSCRLGSNSDDPMGGRMLSNASCTSNSSLAGALPVAVSHPLQQSPSRRPQTLSQLGQNLQEHPRPLMQNLEQKQRSQVTSQKSPRTETYSQSVATTSGESAAVLPSNISTSPAVPKSTLTAAPFDCDWSEHTCPDGCKYYYNCVTCESRWEKPEEYSSFEQLVMKQLKSLSFQQELKPVHIQSSTSTVTACAQQAS